MQEESSSDSSLASRLSNIAQKLSLSVHLGKMAIHIKRPNIGKSARL